MRDFDRNNLTVRRRSGRRRGAFTLIELLVVMGILAILVAIIAGVAGYVMRSANEKDTSATQAILTDAIQAWHDKADKTSPKTYNGYPRENYPNNTQDYMKNLMLQLTKSPDFPSAVRAVQEILLKLPQDAWKGGTDEPVKDAWDKDMRYEQSGGLGGTPVVISAGADGKPNTEDDIRSDESQ